MRFCTVDTKRHVVAPAPRRPCQERSEVEAGNLQQLLPTLSAPLVQPMHLGSRPHLRPQRQPPDIILSAPSGEDVLYTLSQALHCCAQSNASCRSKAESHSTLQPSPSNNETPKPAPQHSLPGAVPPSPAKRQRRRCGVDGPTSRVNHLCPLL